MNHRLWIPILNTGHVSFTCADIESDEDAFVNLNIPLELHYKIALDRSNGCEMVMKDNKLIVYCDEYHLPITFSNIECYDKLMDLIGHECSLRFELRGR